MDLFKLWYRIPEYQRPYVWESENVTALLEDTLAAYRKNSAAEYFLGSMVLKLNCRKVNPSDANSPVYDEYELLDGQQRLTTIFLMLAVMRDITGNPSVKEVCKSAIFQSKNVFALQPERLRIVFDIRDDVRDFIDKFVKVDDATQKLDDLKFLSADKAADISVRNMSHALLVISDFLSALTPQDLDNYFMFFWQKVLMTYVATQELHDAFQLFTVLNTGGVKLRNSDILKVENLSCVPDDAERKNFARDWEEMEKYFGDDFDKFLSYIRTILVKRKADMTLLKEFRENIYFAKKPLLNMGRETFEYIDGMFDIYKKIFDNLRGVNGNFEAANLLTLMNTGLETDYWTAATLSFCKKFGCENGTAYQNFCSFLRLLDKKVSADWICALSPTKRIENVNAVIKEIETADSPDKLFAAQVFDIPRDFADILQADVYGKRYAKYLMLKLDLLYHGHSMPFQPPSTVSIEHILPQTPPQQSQWRKNFSDAQRELWTDKLGNLVLISRRKNSSLGNRDYAYKKQKYFEKNIELFSNSVRVLNSYAQWTPVELQQNHAAVVDKLLAAYE